MVSDSEVSTSPPHWVAVCRQLLALHGFIQGSVVMEVWINFSNMKKDCSYKPEHTQSVQIMLATAFKMIVEMLKSPEMTDISGWMLGMFHKWCTRHQEYSVDGIKVCLKKMIWLQLLKCEYFLVSFLLCDSKLNICETFKDVILGFRKHSVTFFFNILLTK